MTVDLTIQQHNIIDVSFEFPRFVVGDLQLHQNCFFFILFFIPRKKLKNYLGMKFRRADVIKCFAKNYQQYLIEDGVRYS